MKNKNTLPALFFVFGTIGRFVIFERDSDRTPLTPLEDIPNDVVSFIDLNYFIKEIEIVISFQITLVKSYGYEIEEHEVQSEDGYIVTLHRIPYGRGENGTDNQNRPAVLLAHCLMGSSAVFSYGPTNTSLAYVLADEGNSMLY